MYFDRSEAGADGWQAVDSTPQEESGGRFQMGPAAVKQVKAGTSDCFDTDFVIGEVNGDVKLFVYNVPDFSDPAKDEAAARGDFVLHDGDPLYEGVRWYHDPFGDIYNTIGFKTVTKQLDQFAGSTKIRVCIYIYNRHVCIYIYMYMCGYT